MIRLDDLGLFERTAALGSFSNAAREADLLPGQVSAAIQRLERELDVRLFARSTRSLRLTAEGEQYLPYAREVLAVLREGRERLRGEEDALQGLLQIAVPSDLGRNVLLPWLTDFREAHPKLSLRLFFSDQLADVFRDPVDIAIRYGVAESASYVVLPLAEENRRVLVAAPEYLARHGRPRSLDDLAAHHCLLYALGGRVYDKWVFPVRGEKKQIAVSGSLVCDDADVARRWAVDGRGIAYKSWIDVCADVRAGRLEVLLPEQRGEAAPLNLVCPHRKQFFPAIRRLHAALKERVDALMDRLPA
ncbi:MAG TPA: LysR substrate-binding domain-containing protein [Trinickia sp.]|jgi:DNA-binding transcriptional LysR family regulator|uniref:LysR family transcriptional regulator n=1 Tax=Trinickia sp. TaxID=2571163 RepID=UPI002CE530DF|nr:LysR substrate-binding domain-containing protein [Trinickia sp.]HTI16478.1 LysR substrate-binding domain-containing protein [Trinickia sp.]